MSKGKTAKRISMKHFAALCTILIVIALSTLGVYANDDWVAVKNWSFNTDGNLEGWTPVNHITNLTASGGFLNGNITGKLPQLLSADNLNIDLTGVKRIQFLIKNTAGSQVGQIYFTTTGDPTWNETKHREFALPAGASDYTEVTVNMSIISGWAGTLKQLKIGPEAGGEATGGAYGTFSINYIRLLRDPVTAPVLSPGNTTYYISQSGGNDNNNGTSPATPWKTVAKLNTIKFAPGDSILFKRGDIWSDECWYPKGNGNYSLGQWITVDAYGTGNKPQFRAGSKFATVYFEPDTFTGGWKFLNLDIRDAKQGILCNNPNPNSIHGTKYNTPYSPASGLWVENCSFSNITGAQVYAPGAMVNVEYDECQFYASQPILFKYANNVTIKNCTISHCDTPFQTWGDNINVDGVKVDNIYINGVFFMSCTNSIIQNSSFLYMATTGAFTGTAAIMLEDSSNCQIKNTEIGYTQNSDIYPFDAIAVDFEANNINCKVSGCYLHDNEGPAFLIMDHNEPTFNDQQGIVIEDCISVNNGARRTSSHDVSFINLYYNETHKIEVRNCIDIRPAGVFALNHEGSKSNTFPAEHYTVSNVRLETSSRNMLAEDFSGSLSKWTGTENTSTSGQNLTITNNENMRSIAGGSNWTDYSYSVSLKLNQSSAGVVFRSQDLNNYYMWQFTDSSYLVPMKRVNGNWVQIKAPVHISPWSCDNTYNVTIEAYGSTIKTYIQGTLIDTTTDSTFSWGKVGFRQYGTESATFDNAFVWVNSVPSELKHEEFKGDLSGWVNTANASITNAQLNITNNENMRSSGAAFGDFLMEADVKVTAGSAGLVFRSQDSNNYYMWQLDAANSQLKPMKKVGGSFSTLATLSVPSIKINQWNHITILTTGPRVKTYVNGILVSILLDTTFSSGSVGMRESGSESAVFDNIYVNSIAKEWEFTTAAEGWTAGNQIDGFGWHAGGYLEGSVTGGDPYFYSPDNLGIAVSDHQQIRIRMQNGTPCTDLQLFFITDSDPAWNGVKMTTVKILPNSDYTEYLIDMSGVAGWTGTLKQLRIDPSWGQTNGGFSIDYITI